MADKKTKTWTMSETQTQFINALKENGGSATLFELNYLKGYNFKSGSVNALIGKGYVEVEDTDGYKCDLVYNGVKVGEVTKPAKLYRLVNAD